MLDSSEIKLIICGSQIYDFEELYKGTRYMDGFDKKSPTVIHFWEVLYEMTLK